MSISWRDFYNAALLESDWTKIEERIQKAESEIHKRSLTLSQDPVGPQEEQEERDALVHALNGLKTLRADVASWRKRQSGRNDL